MPPSRPAHERSERRERRARRAAPALHAQDIPELPSSESVRIYLDELRPELAFKTMFVTPVTTCEEVVSQILRKYNFGGDSSHYVLGVEQENGRTQAEAAPLGLGALRKQAELY